MNHVLVVPFPSVAGAGEDATRARLLFVRRRVCGNARERDGHCPAPCRDVAQWGSLPPHCVFLLWPHTHEGGFEKRKSRRWHAQPPVRGGSRTTGHSYAAPLPQSPSRSAVERRCRRACLPDSPPKEAGPIFADGLPRGPWGPELYI